MNIVDSMTLYSKYLKIQASKLDLETAGEKAEEICERLQELSHYCKATDKWCDAVEYILKKYGLKDEKSLGAEFSNFRNNDAHGGFIRFTDPSVCAFVVSLVLIECMILEESKYSLEEIKDIINARYL